MVILPYCVVEASESVTVPEQGVCAFPVATFQAHGLSAFYSEVPALPSGAQELQTEALRFHAVVNEIFRQAAVVQFRFPTALPGTEALREHIQERAEEYREFLARVRGLVQMEIRISGVVAAPPASARGREYLLSRRAASEAEERCSAKICSSASEFIREWKTRKTQNSLRCYALVARTGVDVFRERLQSVLCSSSSVRAVVSGPWPATEFLDATIKR